MTGGDPLAAALFCAVLATFLGSPLWGPRARVAAALSGAIAAGGGCALLTGSGELAALAAGLGGVLAFAGPGLGSRSAVERPSPGRQDGTLAGLPRAGARGRW